MFHKSYIDMKQHHQQAILLHNNFNTNRRWRRWQGKCSQISTTNIKLFAFILLLFFVKKNLWFFLEIVRKPYFGCVSKQDRIKQFNICNQMTFLLGNCCVVWWVWEVGRTRRGSCYIMSCLNENYNFPNTHDVCVYVKCTSIIR